MKVRSVKSIAFKLFWLTVNTVSIILLYSLMHSLSLPTKTTVVAGASTTLNPNSYTTPAVVNNYRTSNGLQAMQANPALVTVANQRAEEMVNEGYFAHKNPITGLSYYNILETNGFKPAEACENLYLGYSTDPSTIFEGWKQSSGHNACMLNSNVAEYGYALREFGVSFDDFGNQRRHYIVVMIHSSKD